MFFRKYFILIFSSITFLAIFITENYASSPIFSSFVALSWEDKTGCINTFPLSVDNASKGISILNSTSCRSHSFEIKDRYLSLSYSSDFTREDGGKRPEVKIFSKNNLSKEMLVKELPPTSGVWRDVQFDLGSDQVGSEIVIEFNNRLKKDKSISYIRDRADFFKQEIITPATFFEIDYYVLSKSFIKFLLLSLVCYFILKRERSAEVLFTSFFVISLIQFFSLMPYYYFDEWHVLERFQNLGLDAIFKLHNEHFLPLFFLWYKLLTSLVGERYYLLLIMSSFLHASTAFSIFYFINLFNKEKSFQINLALIPSLYFLLGALHVETIKWAFEQSILLCMLAGIWSLSFLILYLKTNKLLFLLASMVLLISAPLLFGNGLIFIPGYFLLLTLYCFYNKKLIMREIGKYIKIFLLFLLSSLVPVILYILNKDENSVSNYSDFLSIFNYILVGVGLSSFLRGLGLYPNLSLSSSDSFFEIIKPYFLTGDQFLAYIGISILFFTIFFFYKRTDNKLLMIYGCLFLFLSFLLPAVARASLGESQSLALRYQYFSQFAISLLIVSVVNISKFNFFRSKFFYFFAFLWLYQQSLLTTIFSYFDSHGVLHHSYIQQLVDWENRTNSFNFTSYEANTTDLEGLFPLARPSITPGRHPNDIFRTYFSLKDKT